MFAVSGNTADDSILATSEANAGKFAQTLINTLPKTEKTAVKSWITYDANGAEAPLTLPEGSTVKFRLKQYKDGATQAEQSFTVQTVVLDGTAENSAAILKVSDEPGAENSPYTGQETTAWSYTWGNLPQYYWVAPTTEPPVAGGYRQYRYEVEEAEFTYNGVTYTVTPNADGGYTVSPVDDSVQEGETTHAWLTTATLTGFRNRLNETEILIIKEDALQHTLLSGATFTLYKYDDESNVPVEVRSETTGDNGRLTFSALPDARYKIVETVTPNGYVKSITNDIFFKINNGVVTKHAMISPEPTEGTEGITPCNFTIFSIKELVKRG